MEIARVTTKGQITIPIGIRKAMNLKEGDKVIFLEQDGRYFIENSALLAFNRIQSEMSGEAEKAGFRTQEDMFKFAAEIRKEMWEEKYAGND